MNTNYFSIRKAAHDNTRHLYQPETPLYTELFGKNIQMFRKWSYEGNINAIKIDNQFHVFDDTKHTQNKDFVLIFSRDF